MKEGVNIMKDFLNYLKTVRKRNEKTLKQYRSILKHFVGYEPVTWSSFTRYLESIKDNAPKTQRNKITLVKEYITWKLKTGRLELDERTIMLIEEADAPRYKRLPKYLEADELQKLFKAIDSVYWKAFFRFIVNTGARISEVLTFDPGTQASYYENFALINFIGKGNKERTIKIDKDILDEAIQAGIFDKHVTVAGAGQALKRYAKKAGLKKKVSPHVLRHTFAVLQVSKGMSINQLQAVLGHSSVATTGIYLQIASDRVAVPTLL